MSFAHRNVPPSKLLIRPPSEVHRTWPRIHFAPAVPGNVTIAADDAHLMLVEVILGGIHDVDERMVWVQKWLPVTAANLALLAHWSTLSDLGCE